MTVEHDHVGHPHRRPSMSVLGLGLAGSDKPRPNLTCSPVEMLVNAKYMYGGFKLGHFQNQSVVTFNQFEVLETEDQKHRVYLKFVYARGCKKNNLIV